MSNAHVRSRLNPGAQFLWVDGQSARRLQVKRGSILAEPLAGSCIQAVQHGLARDLMGREFSRNITIEKLMSVVSDYDNFKQIYAPAVVDSNLMEAINGDNRCSMRLLYTSAWLTTAVDTQFVARTIRVARTRVYATSQSVSVCQTRNYSRQSQSKLPGQGDGFIWRLDSISRYEQREGAVYIEIEAIVLTREIPRSVRWLIEPIAERLSRNSLLISLRQIRDALRLSKNVELQTLQIESRS